MKSKRSKEDIIFDTINYLFLSSALLIVLYPLYFVLIASFSDPVQVYEGNVWLVPKGITIEGYIRIFNDERIWRGYSNSLFYAITGTGINLFMTLPAAYALSRKDMGFRKGVLLFIAFTMYFSGGLIPTYLLINKLGIYNSVWAMLLPNAVAAFNLIIAKTFFETSVHDELREAAKLDGCSEIRFFIAIALPLSAALIAILTLYYGLAHWNAFFDALIYLKTNKLYPLQLVLREILLTNEVSEMSGDVYNIAEQQKIADLIKYGAVIVASMPMLVLYPFLQKYFVKGVMIGAIKG